MIAIIDYGSGNIGAIANIYKQLKVAHFITDKAADLHEADRFILPGVGAFDETMRHLNSSGMVDALNHQILVQKKKVLGICVGMQILADSSDEGGLPGLGWIPGHVRKIDSDMLLVKPKLPHMGWNSIELAMNHPIFRDVDIARGFYFLHSYYFDVLNSQHLAASVHYGQNLPCAVLSDNVFGMQFHPEKSHSNGVAIFRNFAEL